MLSWRIQLKEVVGDIAKFVGDRKLPKYITNFPRAKTLETKQENGWGVGKSLRQ